MNIIDLATKTIQLAIQTAVASVKTVVDAIKTVVDSTKTKVDTIDTRTTAINTNLNTANTSLEALLAGRVAKSVQRGTFALTGTHPININISTVNPAKCFVIVNGTVSTSDTVILNTLTSTILTLASSSGNFANNRTVSWQVVEFY